MEDNWPEQIYLGKVTQVIDPSNFWMHIGTDESLAEFLQFEINLEDSCRTMGISIEDVEDIGMGQLVLVDCTDTDRMWRRGRVSRVDIESEEVDVHYIDYGDTELVNIDRLCVNQEDFFSYPSQALRCCLAGIKPIARSWTSRATKLFKEMVSNDIFQTVVLAALEPASFRVSLYTNHGDEGIAVAHLMMEQELGLPSDDEVPRLFGDAPKHFNPDTSYTPDYSIWGTPMIGEEPKDEGAWPDSAPDQSSSSDSPPSASYYGTPIAGTDNTDNESEPKVQSHDSEGGEGSDSEEESHTPAQKIPEFDFGRIEKYWDTSTDKLQEKIQIKRHNELEAENMKLKEDMVEQSALTAVAGSGRFSILTYSDDEEDTSPLYDGKFVEDKFISDMYNTNTNSALEDSEKPDKENEPPPITLQGKKKKWDTFEVPPRFQKNNAKKSPQKSRPIPPPPGFSENCVKTESEEIYPTALEYTAVHWSGASDHQVLGAGETLSNYQEPQSHRKERPVALAPLRLGVSDQVSAPWVEDVEILGDHDGEVVNMDSIAALEQTSPTKVDFYRVVNKIFAGVNMEDYDVTAAKLRKLFSTDLFVYLDTDQLQGVINILLNRAVRHYGELHDCLLEIIELLNVAQDFTECIINGIKKLHDMYITVTTKGRPLHTQCSKLFGHLFSLSLFWNDSASSVQKCILDLVERWVYFNKKGTQTGQEDLEQIYLSSFKTIWVIIADILKDRFTDRYDSIQWECRDKLFGANIPRSTKEQLLDLYINCFVVPSEKFTVAVGCQTDNGGHCRHVGCQIEPEQKLRPSSADPQQTLRPPSTDPQQNLGQSSTEPEHKAFQKPSESPKAPQHRTSDSSFSLMAPSSFTAASNNTMPTIPGYATPPRPSAGVISPTWSTALTPMSHVSADSSVYFTPEESPFCAEFPPLVHCATEDGGVKEEKTWVNHIGSQPVVENVPGNESKKLDFSSPTGADSRISQGSLREFSDKVTGSEKVKSPNLETKVSPQNTKKPVSPHSKDSQTQKADAKKSAKQTAKTGQDSVNSKRKEGHHKKGSYPVIRYGLATSVQNTHKPPGELDNSTDTLPSHIELQKKLDMNSIMMDLMTSSDNTRNSTVANDTETKHDSGKKKKSDKKSDSKKDKAIDWWSVDVDGSDADCDSDQEVDLGWSAHNSDGGEVLLNDVKPPIKTTTNSNADSEAEMTSGNTTTQEDDGDLEWETDNSDNNDDELVAAILKRDAGNSRPAVAQPLRHQPRSWQPRVRKCTGCGDDSHTIYDCPHKHKNAFF